MTLHKALHTKDDVNRVYVSRKEGVRGLTSTETMLTHDYNYLKIIFKKHWVHQKQYLQHEDEQNDNEQKTKMGRKNLYERFKRLRDISHKKT